MKAWEPNYKEGLLRKGGARRFGKGKNHVYKSNVTEKKSGFAQSATRKNGAFTIRGCVTDNL